jgi:hypothetical protein
MTNNDLAATKYLEIRENLLELNGNANFKVSVLVYFDLLGDKRKHKDEKSSIMRKYHDETRRGGERIRN